MQYYYHLLSFLEHLRHLRALIVKKAVTMRNVPAKAVARRRKKVVNVLVKIVSVSAVTMKKRITILLNNFYTEYFFSV